MSTESTLDSSEDLENLNSVPLVRMVDVQPIDGSLQYSEENVQTCIIDGAEYECIVDDEESNVGSIVSVKSEEVVYDDGTMFIVPEVVEPPEYLEDPDTDLATQHKTAENQSSIQLKQQDSWPTLEILPGGVINGRNITNDNDGYIESNDMLYACAKCSQSFKYLYCLVKHVKTHQELDDKKKIVSLKPNQANSYICLKPKVKRRMKSKTKARKMPKMS